MDILLGQIINWAVCLLIWEEQFIVTINQVYSKLFLGIRVSVSVKNWTILFKRIDLQVHIRIQLENQERLSNKTSQYYLSLKEDQSLNKMMNNYKLLNKFIMKLKTYFFMILIKINMN